MTDDSTLSMYRPFRKALEALREEFRRSADRYPGLFYEEFGSILIEPSWDVLVEEGWTKREDEWEEWLLTQDESKACGRFYGDGAGVATFKRLAESLFLVLCEMGWGREDKDGVHQCLEAMLGSAADYPTPLLRTTSRELDVENRTQVDLDAGSELLGESIELDDGRWYPAYLLSMAFVHDVFTSAVTFIDNVLDPDAALQVLPGYTTRPPICMDGDELASNMAIGLGAEMQEGSMLDSAEPKKSPYLFRFNGKTRKWLLKFPGDERHVWPNWVGLGYYAKLLKEHGNPLSGSELIGRDPETVEDRPSHETSATEQDIRRTEAECERLRAQIEAAQGEIGMMEQVENWQEQLANGKKWLKNNKNPRGKPKTISRPGQKEKDRKSVGNAIKDVRDQLRDAMPHLVEHLESDCQTVFGQGKWCYDPKEVPPWEF